MGHTTNRRCPRVGKTTAANGLIKLTRMESHIEAGQPKHIGSPLHDLLSLLLDLLQLVASLLLILTSLTIATREKPWRVLSLSLEGQLDCPVCGIPLDPSPIVQPRYDFNSVA